MKEVTLSKEEMDARWGGNSKLGELTDAEVKAKNATLKPREGLKMRPGKNEPVALSPEEASWKAKQAEMRAERNARRGKR